MPTIVLIHSPLVGPLSWSLVAAELLARGQRVAVPVFHGRDDSSTPLWRQQARAIAGQLAPLSADEPLVLVGHSGAGPLLPAFARELGRPVATYLFVDAGLPGDGASVLDEMSGSVPELAAELRAHLEAGGRFPEWTDQDLRDIFPDADLRQELLAELQPRPLSYFTAPLPAGQDWRATPCAYLQFSAAYDAPAQQAQSLGWPVRKLDAGHFHMLVAPQEVTKAMLELLVQQ